MTMALKSRFMLFLPCSLNWLQPRRQPRTRSFSILSPETEAVTMVHYRRCKCKAAVWDTRAKGGWG